MCKSFRAGCCEPAATRRLLPTAFIIHCDGTTNSGWKRLVAAQRSINNQRDCHRWIETWNSHGRRWLLILPESFDSLLFFFICCLLWLWLSVVWVGDHQQCTRNLFRMEHEKRSGCRLVPTGATSNALPPSKKKAHWKRLYHHSVHFLTVNNESELLPIYWMRPISWKNIRLETKSRRILPLTYVAQYDLT